MRLAGEASSVILRGSIVTLRPMARGDAAALFDAARFPELWRWTVSTIETPADMQRYVDTAIDERDAGRSIPFVTVDSATDQVVGSTRFGNISELNRRLEIGWTWLTPSRQRTGANTEAKLLMLTHAFESLDCIRVELKTDVLNEKSRSAMLRIGAFEEGVLRRHVITDSGRIRDTIYYSILADEWPEVKKRLAGFLDQRKSAR